MDDVFHWTRSEIEVGLVSLFVLGLVQSFTTLVQTFQVSVALFWRVLITIETTLEVASWLGLLGV